MSLFIYSLYIFFSNVVVSASKFRCMINLNLIFSMIGSGNFILFYSIFTFTLMWVKCSVSTLIHCVNSSCKEIRLRFSVFPFCLCSNSSSHLGLLTLHSLALGLIISSLCYRTAAEVIALWLCFDTPYLTALYLPPLY